jgi:methionyl-tRNA formyltransferase
MGTPFFAVPSLEALLASPHEVVGVITAPDKPAGRGRRVQGSAVKAAAQKAQLPVWQPVSLKDPQWLRQLEEAKPELIVVVAFRMLPKVVWALPPQGTINLHASLLPQYRGAAPINWALINGEKETGLTTFRLDKTIDTGAILGQTRLPIQADETAGSLHDKMLQPGAELLLHTVNQIARGEAEPQPQREQERLKKAPKLGVDDTWLPWEAPVAEISAAERDDTPAQETPGRVLTDGRSYLKVACADGYLVINEAQLPGKRRLFTPEMLNGFKISPEAQFITST